MSLADQALWVMERNSDQALSLNDIAAACGVSRSHLANAFVTASGWSVMKYLKARRLTRAAERLAGGARDILSVALDCGYGSHEAFSRAFRDQFGQTPEQVRSQGNVEGLATTPPLRLRCGQARSLLPQLARLDRLKLVGLSAPCSPDETIRIPAQWQQFMSSCYYRIAHKLGEVPIGVCEPPDDQGCFNYVCAAQVASFEGNPPELACFDCEPRRYAVFSHDDHVSRIFETYAVIWNQALPAMGQTAADSPVLEFHNDAFNPDTGLGGLQLYIPLEDEGGRS